MYNVRVSAEFLNANINDPLYTSGTMKREGDLSEVHVADIYRRKLTIDSVYFILRMMYLGTNYVIHYDNQLSRPYNLSYSDLTSNSVKLLFSFNETNSDPHRQIQKLEVCYQKLKSILYNSSSRFIMQVYRIISMV